MSSINSYDLGWRVGLQSQLAHWFRTNEQSLAAVSHCGLMQPKRYLYLVPSAQRCPWCLLVQDAKDKATAAERRAISLNKPLPVGIQTGKGVKYHE